jgi:ABC-2 type transport system permease protein
MVAGGDPADAGARGPRPVREPVLLVLQLLGAAVAGFLLLIVAGRHNVRFDFTPEQTHTLAPPTREVAARVDRDVTITAFYSGQEPARRREMTDLLRLYADASPRLRVRILDLDRSPGLAKQLGVTKYNTGVIADGERRIPLGIVDEEEITGALIQLVEPVARPVYFTSGHGESDPFDVRERGGYSRIAKALESERYDVRPLAGIGITGVPADAGLVVVAGARADFAPAEVDALRRYVASGGSVILLLDPGTPAVLAAFLREYGMTLGDDLVVDERNALLGTDSLMPRVPYLNQAVFPRAPELPAVLAEAQSVALAEEPPTGMSAAYLASSSEESWAAVDRGRLAGETPTFNRDRDRRGPVPVAALARLAGPAGPGTGGAVVVVGDSDFASNLYLGVLGNRDLFLAIVGLLARRELHGTLRPARPGGALSPISLSTRQARLLFWGTVVMPPALAAVAGIVGAIRRRRFR